MPVPIDRDDVQRLVAAKAGQLVEACLSGPGPSRAGDRHLNFHDKPDNLIINPMLVYAY
jgi:hypothetical protein